MLNHIDICGRLTDEPEIKKMTNGTFVALFTLAVDRNRRERYTDYINCVAFNEVANIVYRTFHKHKMVIVSGMLTSRNYLSRDGERKMTNEVVIQEVNNAGVFEYQTLHA